MPYEPTIWQTGDVITAEKLNNIETGIASIGTNDYEPTVWANGDVISAEKLNKIEQALYELSGGGGDEPPAGYVTVAPMQSVTVGDDPVAITLADGAPETLPNDWTLPDDWIVMLNGTQATYDTQVIPCYKVEVPAIILCYVDTDTNKLTVDAGIAGTYTVAVYAPEDSGGGGIDEPNQ